MREDSALRCIEEEIKRYWSFEEVIVLKNYAKAVLYAYPLLKTVEEDYEAHIKNKALLSYEKSAERVATCLAGEILEMRRLEWLKAKIGEVLQGLTEVERTLVAIRYFGKSKQMKALMQKPWTERTYFRKQQRLGEKLGGLLVLNGVTEECFMRELLPIEMLQKIYRGVEEGRDRKISCHERQWLGV